jgi:diguanylate cyclase (GGDEF)-like protein
VEATDARSAVFEPVLRDGAVAGVLIVIWRVPLEALPDAPGGVLRLLAAQAAVAIEHATLRERLAGLSFTDPLTGLATRRMWDEELPRELARTRRSESPLTIAAIDIDHMSAFNMLRGEREGDRLIKECGSRWRNELREVDFLARVDGTEFAMILPNCGLGEACDVLDRVREATPRGQTASAGVARWDGEEPAELFLARAQDALAAAKSAGRNVTIAAD